MYTQHSIIWIQQNNAETQVRINNFNSFAILRINTYKFPPREDMTPKFLNVSFRIAEIRLSFIRK
jgi:hypothetical protein